MPLVYSTIRSELSKIMDPDDPNFVGYPSSTSQMANNWANAVNEYAKTVFPISSTSSAAKSAMEGVFMGMVAPMSGLVIFPAAFSAYAAALSPGMIVSNFNGIPPPSPIILAPAFAVPLLSTTLQIRIDTMATIIDTWFKTGTAINISSGATVPWS